MRPGSGLKRKLDVLLVEDNPADSRFVRLALTSGADSGFAVTEAARRQQSCRNRLPLRALLLKPDHPSPAYRSPA